MAVEYLSSRCELNAQESKSSVIYSSIFDTFPHRWSPNACMHRTFTINGTPSAAAFPHRWSFFSQHAQVRAKMDRGNHHLQGRLFGHELPFWVVFSPPFLLFSTLKWKSEIVQHNVLWRLLFCTEVWSHSFPKKRQTWFICSDQGGSKVFVS